MSVVTSTICLPCQSSPSRRFGEGPERVEGRVECHQVALELQPRQRLRLAAETIRIPALKLRSSMYSPARKTFHAELFLSTTWLATEFERIGTMSSRSDSSEDALN